MEQINFTSVFKFIIQNKVEGERNVVNLRTLQMPSKWKNYYLDINVYISDLSIRFWECCYLNMDSSSVMYPVILSMIVMLVRCQEDSVNEIVRVSGLLGGTVKLPCDTSPPSPINPLLLTIWFKDQLQDPIYRCRYIQCQLLLVAPDMQGSKFKITTTHMYK